MPGTAPEKVKARRALDPAVSKAGVHATHIGAGTQAMSLLTLRATSRVRGTACKGSRKPRVSLRSREVFVFFHHALLAQEGRVKLAQTPVKVEDRAPPDMGQRTRCFPPGPSYSKSESFVSLCRCRGQSGGCAGQPHLHLPPHEWHAWGEL